MYFQIHYDVRPESPASTASHLVSMLGRRRDAMTPRDQFWRDFRRRMHKGELPRDVESIHRQIEAKFPFKLRDGLEKLGQIPKAPGASEVEIKVARIDYGSLEIVILMLGLTALTGTDSEDFRKRLQNVAADVLNEVFGTDVPLNAGVDVIDNDISTSTGPRRTPDRLGVVGQVSPFFLLIIFTGALIYFWQASFSKLLDRDLEDRKLQQQIYQSALDYVGRREAMAFGDRALVLYKAVEMKADLMKALRGKDEPAKDTKEEFAKQLKDALTGPNPDVLKLIRDAAKP